VHFTPDDTGLVSVSMDGTARLWPDDLPESPEKLRAWFDTVDVPSSLEDHPRRSNSR
jgi:eukaryotic-like serine/threonine-protein kinase